MSTRKEFKMAVDIKPIEEEDKIKMPQENEAPAIKQREEMEENPDSNAMMSVLQNLQQSIENINSRLSALESEEEQEDVMVGQEDLKGVPERDTGDSKEKPKMQDNEVSGVPVAGKPLVNPIPSGQTQTTTGSVPNSGDEAEKEVPKPASDYPKDKVVKNQMDEEDEEEKKKEELKDDPTKPMPGKEAPAQPDAMKVSKESFVDKELNRLKESLLGDFDKKQKAQENFENSLMERQSVVSMASPEKSQANAEAYMNRKATVMSTIREYLSKSSNISPANKLKFGIRQ